MTHHAFVDESIANSYTLVAVSIHAGQVAAARKIVRGQLLGNQRRIHYKDESIARKRKIIAAIVELGPSAHIFVAQNNREARKACLTAMVPQLVATGVTRIVIERDDSIARLDRTTLYRSVRAADANDRVEYLHMRAHEELLLCLPDAIAWCWVKGGAWRDAVAHFTTATRVQ